MLNFIVALLKSPKMWGNGAIPRKPGLSEDFLWGNCGAIWRDVGQSQENQAFPRTMFGAALWGNPQKTGLSVPFEAQVNCSPRKQARVWRCGIGLCGGNTDRWTG
jgi:hypothetical protein